MHFICLMIFGFLVCLLVCCPNQQLYRGLVLTVLCQPFAGRQDSLEVISFPEHTQGISGAAQEEGHGCHGWAESWLCLPAGRRTNLMPGYLTLS